MSAMDDLVSFVRARLDEDEAVITRNRGKDGLGDDAIFPDYRTWSDEDTAAADDYLSQFPPPRMQAEVEAKRRMLDECVHELARSAPRSNLNDFACTVLRNLALPYAEHPDCRPEWRP